MPELRLENSLVDDRYEVRERLGLGSYAEIFVARDHRAEGEEVVIKALNTSLQGTPADLRGVPFHYLVLEYMPGGDLLKLCRARPGNALSLSEALLYFKQVCEALAYAHGQGVIH